MARLSDGPSVVTVAVVVALYRSADILCEPARPHSAPGPACRPVFPGANFLRAPVVLERAAVAGLAGT